MYPHTLSYLRYRAIGTPAATLWLVSNGIFRGLGDTLTPLKYSLVLTGLNAILDPLLIFPSVSLGKFTIPGMNLGCAGAAAGTAFAQYTALVGILWELNKVTDLKWNLRTLWPSLVSYVSAASLVLARTFGKVIAYAVCSRRVALLGPIAAATHNLMFNLGVAMTQVCESVAVATQTLLARELSVPVEDVGDGPAVGVEAGEWDKSAVAKRRARGLWEKKFTAWHIINRGVVAGGAVALTLSALSLLFRQRVVQGLTTSEPVQALCLRIMPLVLLTQVAKGLAYPINGVIMGGLDWRFSTVAMWIANALCIGTLSFGKSLTGARGLENVWLGLSLFMWSQCFTGVWRFCSGFGPWSVLKSKDKDEKES